MNLQENMSGIISGVALILLGTYLIYVGFGETEARIIVWLYGAISLGVGLYMLLNLNKENEIEEVKK